MTLKDDLNTYRQEFEILRRKGIIVTKTFSEFIRLAVKDRLKRIKETHQRREQLSQE